MSEISMPAEANLPTRYGNFKVMVWSAPKGQESVAVVTPKLDTTKPVLVRVHSECLTGDVFGSYRCDCCDQKEEALRQISKSGNGVFIYLRQEGRGMGLFDKIRSYKLQEEGIDTHEASIMLGHEPDSREYSWAVKILEELSVKQIRLLTNNPAKLSELFEAGFDIEKVPLIIKPTKYNAGYFEIKRKKFKHTFGESEMYHFYGITYSNYDADINELLSFLKKKRVHPLLKFHIGLYVDHAVLESEERIRTLKALVERISSEENTIPVLHYNSEQSPKPETDLKTIAKVFAPDTWIQLNNVTDNYISLLEKAPQKLRVIAPLSEENFQLIDNARFRKALAKRSSFILLDNSKGTGKSESYESFKEKIGRCLNYGLNNIALAGGFGADNLDTYFKLKHYFKLDFSIDAESRLQTESRLDVHKAEDYFDQLLLAQVNPKDKYIAETKSLTAQSREMSQPETALVCGHEISIYPQVFNPHIFFSSCWFAKEVSKEVEKQKAKTFCEIGSGTGIVSLIVGEDNHDTHLTACDINPLAVQNTKENLARYGLDSRSSVEESNVFSSLQGKAFDIIFWALPFGYLPPDTQMDDVDYQTFDPGYVSIEEFFKKGSQHLTENGKLLFGFSPEIGHMELIQVLARKYDWELNLISQEEGAEKSVVKMQIYSATVPV